MLTQNVFFSEMDHHTALKLVPLWSSDLKTSECTEFGPLTIKESDDFAKMCFLRNGSSYSFESCAIVIITPQNLRVHWLWPTKYKEKWCFGPKCAFFRSGSSYSFETCTTVIITPQNLRVNWIWYSKYKRKGCFSPKCVFSEMDHHTALKLVPLWSSDLKTSECTVFDPLNTMKSDVLAQDVLFLETDHHTAMKLYHCKWHGWKPQSELSLAL